MAPLDLRTLGDARRRPEPKPTLTLPTIGGGGARKLPINATRFNSGASLASEECRGRRRNLKRGQDQIERMEVAREEKNERVNPATWRAFTGGGGGDGEEMGEVEWRSPPGELVR
jgi:hypothetical protein